MRRKIKQLVALLLSFLFCFISACSPYNNISNSEPKQMEIIDSGKYYRIYRGSINQVCYDIYNSEGEVVLSEKTDRPLEINMINDDIIDIEIGMGTGIIIHKYYSIGDNIFSQEFPYVLSNLDKLIAYIDVPKEKPLENRKVIVQNIFDKSLFYKEFQLDFSNVDTPVIEAKFSKDGESLQLTYLSGEEQTQISSTYAIKSELQTLTQSGLLFGVEGLKYSFNQRLKQGQQPIVTFFPDTEIRTAG